jgi:hypothetical protein
MPYILRKACQLKKKGDFFDNKLELIDFFCEENFSGDVKNLKNVDISAQRLNIDTKNWDG